VTARVTTGTSSSFPQLLVSANPDKVFGIGLSRTGTKKLHAVLTEAGYRSRHYVPELFDPPDWSVVDGADALTDFPVPHLYKELDHRYPGAKFVLTTRDLDSWLDSVRWMFKHGPALWRWGPEAYEYLRRLYGTTRYRRALLTDRWYAYHADVADHFAGRQEDLLILDISGGFDTDALCDFLGVPGVAESGEKRVNARRMVPLSDRSRYKLGYVRQSLRAKLREAFRH